ncbi:MAG: hypothetical protein HUJ68_01625 [Clostridia bacterium]|nr:hypothetical protein [Clostridia bacterium]
MSEENLNFAYDFLGRLEILANIVNIGTFLMEIEQTSNDKIYESLEVQNREYLGKIIKNQEEIFTTLKSIDSRLKILENK